MALNSMGLGVTFTARDAMSGVLGRLQRAFSGLEVTSKAAVAGIGAGFGAMAAGIGMTVAGLASLEGALNIASAAGRFQAQIQKIGQVAGLDDTTDRGKRQLGQLSDAVIDASQSSGFGTTEVGAGLEDIAAMGFTATQSMQMLTPALGLAAAGTISVADAAGAMGSAMKVFGLATDQATMTETASRLLGIANTTALQAHDLRIALGTVGRGAAAAKQDLDEMLISMGLVKNTGVDATVAASSVSSALLFMAEKSKEFDKIGVSVTDADGHFRNFLDVVLDVRNALANTGNDAEAVAQVKDLFQRFGITAYQGIATQLETGIFDEMSGQTYYLADAVAHLRREQDRFAKQGLVIKYAQKMFNNFDGTLKRIKATWETLIIAVGSGFAEAILPMARLLLNALVEVEHFIRRIPAPAKRAGAMIFLLGAAMTVATGAALIFAGAIVAIGAAVHLAFPELLAFVGAFLAVAIPITAAALAMTALAAAFALAGAAWYAGDKDGFFAGIAKGFNDLKTMISAVITFWTNGELTGKLAEDFMGLSSGTQNALVDIVLFGKKIWVWATAFWERLKEIMGTEGPKMFDGVWSGFMRIFEALGLVDSKMYDASKTMGGADFATKGKIFAETFARALVRVAEIFEVILKLIALTIEAISQAWSVLKWSPLGLALQAQMWIARKTLDLDDPREGDAETIASAERRKDYENLPYQQRMYANSLEGQAGTPTDVREALHRQMGDQSWVRELLEKKPELNQTIQVTLQVDGEDLATAQGKVQGQKQAATFGADAPRQ